MSKPAAMEYARADVVIDADRVSNLLSKLLRHKAWCCHHINVANAANLALSWPLANNNYNNLQL